MAILITRVFMFGHPVMLVCDRKCHKAWGINNRPKVYLDDPNQTTYPNDIDHYPNVADDFDYDNYAYLADDELSYAPLDPGTYEGGHGKPFYPETHNKWCARECERCKSYDFAPDAKLPILRPKDLSRRRYNRYPHDRDTISPDSE